MSDALTLGEKIVSLLHESARSSTYKPALLLALLDRAPEFLDEEGRVPVRALAERVVELYWPQTLAYPTSGSVLLQNQAGGQARIVRDVLNFRAAQSATARSLPQKLRDNRDWERLLMRVELTLAQWPIPACSDRTLRFSTTSRGLGKTRAVGLQRATATGRGR